LAKQVGYPFVFCINLEVRSEQLWFSCNVSTYL
jgi:hypothetical protein